MQFDPDYRGITKPEASLSLATGGSQSKCNSAAASSWFGSLDVRLNRWLQTTGRPHGLSLPSQIWELALEHVSDGVLVADMRQRGHPIVRVNPAFEAITGYTAVEAIGKNCRYLQGSDRLQSEIAVIRSALAKGEPCSVTLRNYRRDGTLFRNALRLQPLVGASGQLTHFVGLIRDVTRAAGIDRLTGLLDRYGLLDRLAAMAQPADSTLLLVKLDILKFHDVNHGFGYDTGDALLCSAAARLATLPAAALSRVGTNSFVVACNISDPTQAGSMVDGILNRLRPRFVLPGASLAVHFAAGFAMGKVDGDPLQLVRQAAAALQRSKAKPPHPPEQFEAADERKARNRIRLAHDLQSAAASEELLLHYQPQFDLDTGDLVGAEALLRWNHGAFGLQPPSRFIGVAEETGAILEIGASGLRMLTTLAARINQGHHAPLRFAGNVSVIEFMRGDIVGLVKRLLDETGCRPEWLTLELTENLMVTDPDHIRQALGALRNLGVEISIDDFGTGYSSLRYLERFPLSEIKIDRSFVHDVAHSPVKRVIVESIVRLGATLDIRVIAEGIETDLELCTMKALGCSVGQGFLLAAPMDGLRFQQFVKERMHRAELGVQ